MQNTSRTVKEDVRVEILNKFMAKLRRSGYSERLRMEILTAGLNGYYSKVKTENKGGRKVNQDSKASRGVNKIKKIVNKNKWYQKGDNRDENEKEIDPKHKGNAKSAEIEALKAENSNKNNKTEAVVFIPPHT